MVSVHPDVSAFHRCQLWGSSLACSMCGGTDMGYVTQGGAKRLLYMGGVRRCARILLYIVRARRNY